MGRLSDLRENPWIKLILALCGIGLVLLFLRAIQTVVVYFLVAFIAAYICDPIIDWMEARKIHRTAGVAILTLGIVAAFLLFWFIAIPAFQHEIARLTSDFPAYVETIGRSVIPWVETTFSITLPTDYAAWTSAWHAHEGTIRSYAEQISKPAWNLVSQMFSSVFNMVMGLLGLIVIPVAWFYLLRDIDPLKARIFEFVPLRYKEATAGFLKEVDEAVSNFLRGQLMVVLALSILYIVGLVFIARVPLGFMIGLFAGSASIVPYLGLIMGIVPAIVLALLEHGDWIHPLLVVAVFTVAQVLEGTVITPKIVGDKLGLHPVTVIFAILIWGELLGFVGILIAVPATAVLVVALKRLSARYFKSDFYMKKMKSPLDGDDR